MNDGCYYLYNPSVFAPFSSTSASVTDIDFDFDGRYYMYNIANKIVI